MEIPVEIVLRGADSIAKDAEQDIKKHAEKLGQFHQRISHIRVVVEIPHKHHQHGKHYLVKIDLTLPNKKIFVNRNPHQRKSHEELSVAIRDAFDAARRRLEDFAREVRGVRKSHETPPHGKIEEINETGGFGFIRSTEGKRIYFHQNSVLAPGFGKLKLGGEVRFTEETGEKGPQASTVRLVGKHHVAD